MKRFHKTVTPAPLRSFIKKNYLLFSLIEVKNEFKQPPPFCESFRKIDLGLAWTEQEMMVWAQQPEVLNLIFSAKKPFSFFFYLLVLVNYDRSICSFSPIIASEFEVF